MSTMTGRVVIRRPSALPFSTSYRSIQDSDLVHRCCEAHEANIDKSCAASIPLPFTSVERLWGVSAYAVDVIDRTPRRCIEAKVGFGCAP